jgi:hypothetical protein
MMEKKTVPTGVKIISIFYYIGAVFGVLFGILFLVSGGIIAEQIPLLGLIGGFVFIIFGLVLLSLGILGIFIGRGLWKGRNWARILAIIFAVLGILLAVASFWQGMVFSGITNLFVNGLIGGYLLFSKKVKDVFIKNI